MTDLAGTTQRNADIVALRRSGTTLKTIADCFGITPCRVFQILERAKERGDDSC